MKKFLLISVLSLVSLTSVFACWFTIDDINKAYIAGVNFYKSHYEQTSSIGDLNNLEFKNNLSVSLPLTVWFKVQPRFSTVNGERKQINITYSCLFYKIIPCEQDGSYDYENGNYKWRLAKSIDMNGKKWELNFNTPVKLFGNNTLTLEMIKQNEDSIKKNDKIILAWYICDDAGRENAKLIIAGSSQPFMNLEEDIIKGNVVLGGSIYDYRGAYVISVIYNGKKTLGR